MLNFKVENIKAAIIVARYKEQWILVRQKGKSTWEVPGGRREVNESILTCAKRELEEETGAANYTLIPIRKIFDKKVGVYHMLFYAEVHSLPKCHQYLEIEEIRLFVTLPEKLTYKEETIYFFTLLNSFLKQKN